MGRAEQLWARAAPRAHLRTRRLHSFRIYVHAGGTGCNAGRMPVDSGRTCVHAGCTRLESMCTLAGRGSMPAEPPENLRGSQENLSEPQENLSEPQVNPK